MLNYVISDTNLASIANAIRAKAGTSSQIEFPSEFVSAIANIPTGGYSNYIELLIAQLTDIGFVFTEFVPSTPASGQYIKVPHSLGTVPTDAIAFRKGFVFEDPPTSYQLSLAIDSNFAKDNSYNRTYTSALQSSANINVELIRNIFIPNDITSVPYLIRTNYNAMNSATSEYVELRSGVNMNTIMMPGDWYLGVR